MTHSLHLKSCACLVVLSAALFTAGCKSAPELTASNAQALIQAKYDQQPAAGANVRVDDLGMRQGLEAKYWTRTKMYPNKFWADFQLTADGKKAVKLPGGGDVIQWRPASADDPSYSVMVETAAVNHLKAHDVTNIHDETVPGVEGMGKAADYTESVAMDGVPAPLQGIAHNPGNKLSSKHTANFALDNGAWKLVSTN